MRIRTKATRLCVIASLGLLSVVFHSGCWWQRDSYTDRMRYTFDNWEKIAELNRLLGPAFESPNTEFPLWFRPPKPTELRGLPAELETVFIGLFQGNEASGNLIEVVIMGSAGTESLQEFEQKSFAALNTAQRGPGIASSKQESADVACMHGGNTLYEVFSVGGERAVASQTGQAANAGYQWVFYFTEEPPQKVLIAFIIPDAQYESFTNALVKSLESLALSSKVGIAQGGGGGASAPAAAPGGGAPAGAGSGPAF